MSIIDSQGYYERSLERLGLKANSIWIENETGEVRLKISPDYRAQYINTEGEMCIRKPDSIMEKSLGNVL